MIKMIIGTFVTIFVLVTAIVVFYWRDTQHDATGQDMLLFFGLLPVALTTLVVMPFLLKKWYQESQEKKQEALKQQDQQDEVIQDIPAEKIEWIELNVFQSSSWSALGENEAIWDQLADFKSPELDQKLVNGYGLPILSYRIAELDDLMTTEDEDDFVSGSLRQRRIESLIQNQLEQNTESLWAIAEHLKQSALFYESQLAQEYRMHPAWIDPQADQSDLDVEHKIEQVSRLNRLDIHLILAEDLLHVWDESSTHALISEYLDQLGIITQKFHVELHYWGKETSYKEWMNLLKQIQKNDDIVSYVIVADSEIDQDTIDEKTWVSEQYIPAEFVASSVMANMQVNIQRLDAQKTIKIAQNETHLKNSLEQLASHELEQFQQEQAFVIQLDDITDLKVVKRLQTNFSDTPIEQHHYLYMKASVGQTEHVAKVFGFMLSLHAPESMMSMVYCCDLPHTQSFVQPVKEQEQMS